MCGITCVLAKNNINVIEYLYNSLNLLQNRGYDSVGVAYATNKASEIHVKKYASTDTLDSLKLLKEKMIGEDDERRAHDEIQGITDKHVANIDQVLAEKESELMEF